MLCKAEWQFCAHERGVLTSGLCSWRLVLSHAAKMGMGNSIEGRQAKHVLVSQRILVHHDRKLAILHPNFTEISDLASSGQSIPWMLLNTVDSEGVDFWAIVRKLPDASWSGERDRSPSMGSDPIGTSSDSDPPTAMLFPTQGQDSGPINYPNRCLGSTGSLVSGIRLLFSLILLEWMGSWTGKIARWEEFIKMALLIRCLASSLMAYF